MDILSEVRFYSYEFLAMLKICMHGTSNYYTREDIRSGHFYVMISLRRDRPYNYKQKILLLIHIQRIRCYRFKLD